MKGKIISKIFMVFAFIMAIFLPTESLKANAYEADVIPPEFIIGDPNRECFVKDSFAFDIIELLSEEDIAETCFVKELISPYGETLYTISGRGEIYRVATRLAGADAYTFETAGQYTVRYSVIDKVGNTSAITGTILVNNRWLDGDVLIMPAENSQADMHIGDKFVFDEIGIKAGFENHEALETVHYRKILCKKNGAQVYVLEGDGESFRTAKTEPDSDGYVFTESGIYFVFYSIQYDGGAKEQSAAFYVFDEKSNDRGCGSLIMGGNIAIAILVILSAGILMGLYKLKRA